MRRKKKGYLRHRSMFAFRFLGFGETTVHQMPPCHDLFAERPSFIRILSNRLAIFVVPTDIAQTSLLSDQANLSTRCLNENSDWKKKKKKKKFEYFLSSCHKSFQSFSIKIKRETIRTLIFFPLNLKIKNNILLCLSEIKFTLHDWKHTRFCKRRRNNYKRKFII